jgi:hypothetical protein
MQFEDDWISQRLQPIVILSAAKDLRYLTTEPDPSLRSG